LIVFMIGSGKYSDNKKAHHLASFFINQSELLTLR